MSKKFYKSSKKKDKRVMNEENTPAEEKKETAENTNAAPAETGAELETSNASNSFEEQAESTEDADLDGGQEITEDPADIESSETGRGKVIVITSGKGGVGKTTTTANIGTALAKNGYSTVLVDTDIGLRNLDLLLGLENRIVYNVVDAAEGRCKLKQALVKDKRNPNLYLLAAAQTRDKTAVDAEQMKKITQELKKDFDYIIVDCPAGIEQGFQTAVAGASEAVVVTTPEMSAVRDADRIIGLLDASENIKSYKLLINRVRPNMISAKDMMSVEDVEKILSCRKIGVIPEDTGIITSTNRGEPIVNDEKSPAGRAYINTAKRIAGEDVPFLDINEPKNFAGKIKKLIASFAKQGKHGKEQ